MTKKIIEFASEPFLPRRKFWQASVEEFQKMEFIDAHPDKEELKKNHSELFQNMDAAFISEEYSGAFFEIFQNVTRRILEGRKIDSLFKTESGIWPQCLMREALHELIIQKASRLDTQMRAYVTGSGASMRVALAMLVQLGFSEINIVVDEPEMAQSILSEVNKTFLLVNFHVLRNTDLTLQPNNGSLLINTVRLEEKGELIEDLSYLNFISLDGLVVDLNLQPVSNQLMEEAGNVGLKILSGIELQGYMDWLFLKRLFGHVSLTSAQYLQKWEEFFKNKP